MRGTDLPPVAELVPQRGVMLLLDRVLAHDGESTTAGLTVGRSGWLDRRDGSVPAWLALEYMAQCAAAHEGMLARAEGRSLPLGFLAAAQDLRLERCFAAGEALRVRAQRTRGRPGLGVLGYRCEVHAGRVAGAVLAAGRLLVAMPRPGTVP